MTQPARKRGPRKPDSWGMDEWFMCFPGPWIESYMGLDHYQFRVGVTLLMLIYETDKPLKAPERYLAGKCGLGVKKFKEVVDQLVAAQKLTRDENGALSHPKCEEVLAIRRAYRASKSHPSSSSAQAEREHSASTAGDQREQKSENDNENKDGSQSEATRNSVKGKGKGKGSSELSNESSGGPPAPPPELSQAKPAKRDDWAVLGRLLRPDHEGWQQPPGSTAWKRARDAGGRLVNKIQAAIKISLGEDRRGYTAAIISDLADIAERMAPAHAQDVGYLTEAARGLIAERFGGGSATPSAQFKIVTRDGLRVRINLKTGEESILPEAA